MGAGLGQWLAWGVIVLAVAGLGLRLRCWADAYARRLESGDEASAGTLLRAGLDPGRGRDSADVWVALALAGPAGGLLLVQGWAVLSWVVVGLVLVVLAWVDARSGLLPDALTLPLMVAGWAWGPLSLAEASSASALVWCGLSTMAWLYRGLRGREGFGGGDIKYLAALAAWLGIPSVCRVLWLACLLGVLAWVFLQAVRTRGGCRFGPCLTAAALPVMAWGDSLGAF